MLNTVAILTTAAKYRIAIEAALGEPPVTSLSRRREHIAALKYEEHQKGGTFIAWTVCRRWCESETNVREG